METDTFTQIKEIILEQLKCSEDIIKPDALLQDDLGTDSIDRVELMMVFEQAFRVEIPEKDSHLFNTISDVVAYIDHSLVKK